MALKTETRKYTRRLRDSRDGTVSYVCEGCGAQYLTANPDDAYRAALQCAHGHLTQPVDQRIDAVEHTRGHSAASELAG